MVMNSFGNRNFMQPTGRLSKHPKSLVFFPFKVLGGGRGGGFFSFFLCSQHVPFQVPNMFPRYSMCSSRVFPITLHFNPICFGQNSSPSHLFTWAKGGRTPFSHKIFYFGGACIDSTFFCDGQIKLANCQKEKEKKLDLWGNPNQLIWNRINTPRIPAQTCTWV
jgi:hypothetical protein